MNGKGAFGQCEPWSVDVDANTLDGSIVVTIIGPSFYLDYTALNCKTIIDAIGFLNDRGDVTTIELGIFCGDVPVQIWADDKGVLYLLVSKQDEQSVAYTLADADQECLRTALQSVASQLGRWTGQHRTSARSIRDRLLPLAGRSRLIPAPPQAGRLNGRCKWCAR